ncbi:putative sulfate exporter family transporter [Sphingomonas cavernae]|uniref:Putative sulfate exporter family transporter n=2 Tax=Sphingomonas cavernae TaxID=2320861 RepID=A0A418WSQ9_9SPHN|nr:putative sulfate exporter family transporter [Sphingomonas cavernae]RJF94298.1 putative sulfate exporter family transporter [Sphingomonas cavernae]
MSTRSLPQGADLYGDLEPAPRVTPVHYLPGLGVAVLATLAAGYLSDHYGAPLTLMALLIGLSLNFLSADARLAPGLAFASRTLLRLGIVLVGLRVTIAQVADLGPWALVALLLIVAATIGAGVVAARTLGLGAAFGTLAGGAVAICGASAALALAAVLGERRASQAQLTLVLVIVSALSSFAMFLYPIVAHLMRLDDTGAGFLIGASIHDVAQALGAGYSFSPGAGETAAIVKLARVALLAPVLALAALYFPTEGAKRTAYFRLPWFVIGFFALAALNSAITIPAMVGDIAQQTASAMLACAVAATGMRSPMNTLLDSGPRPMLAVVIPTVVALALAAMAAALLS